MTRIDRGQAGSEQGEQCRLRPLQHERCLIVAVADDLFEVAVPRPAGADAQFFVRFAGQQIPSAFDVTGSERLAVVPMDRFAQIEGEPRPILTPRPVGGELGDDRLLAVLRDVLIVDDEVVEHAHHRQHGRQCRLFEDRHARRAVSVVDFQNTAGFLRRRLRRRHSNKEPSRRRGRQYPSRFHRSSHKSSQREPL